MLAKERGCRLTKVTHALGVQEGPKLLQEPVVPLDAERREVLGLTAQSEGLRGAAS